MSNNVLFDLTTSDSGYNVFKLGTPLNQIIAFNSFYNNAKNITLVVTMSDSNKPKNATYDYVITSLSISPPGFYVGTITTKSTTISNIRVQSDSITIRDAVNISRSTLCNLSVTNFNLFDVIATDTSGSSKGYVINSTGNFSGSSVNNPVIVVNNNETPRKAVNTLLTLKINSDYSQAGYILPGTIITFAIYKSVGFSDFLSKSQATSAIQMSCVLTDGRYQAIVSYTDARTGKFIRQIRFVNIVRPTFSVSGTVVEDASSEFSNGNSKNTSINSDKNDETI